ncbi:MAG TPA: hypothetical protein VF473_07820 [Cyclobacteriaceae bacterium]
MKTILSYNTIRVLAIMLFTFTTTLALCQNEYRKVKFEVSEIEPTAEGTVKIDKDKNNNYTVDLTVTGLSKPDRLTPPRTSYVVWMETAQNGTQNLGQLKSSEAALSKAMKGSLNAVTPYQPVSFFVTAEDQGNVTTPGQTVVLKTPRVQ